MSGRKKKSINQKPEASSKPAVRPVLAVAAAELNSFWSSFSSGVALLVFLGLLGFFFYNTLAAYVLDSLGAAARGMALDASVALFSQGLTHIPLVLMLVTPLVTMRSLASYRRGGDLDFFQTLPVDGGPLILGQYLAALISLTLMWSLALVPFAALILAGIGSVAILLTTGLGLLALSSSFAAMGLWASAVFPSPVGAGLGTLGGIGLLWALGWAAPYSEGGLGSLWAALAFAPRFSRLAVGLVNIGDLIFFGILTLAALFNARLWLNLRRQTGAD